MFFWQKQSFSCIFLRKAAKRFVHLFYERTLYICTTYIHDHGYIYAIIIKYIIKNMRFQYFWIIWGTKKNRTTSGHGKNSTRIREKKEKNITAQEKNIVTGKKMLLIRRGSHNVKLHFTCLFRLPDVYYSIIITIIFIIHAHISRYLHIHVQLPNRVKVFRHNNNHNIQCIHVYTSYMLRKKEYKNVKG